MTRNRLAYTLPLALLLAGAARAQTGQPLAILDINVVDVVHGSVVNHQSVIIENGRIAEVGPADAIKLPPQAVRIPAQGRYLIPGLWDMHIHLRNAPPRPWVPLIEENSALLALFLPNGVVGVREMGGDLPAQVLQWREEIRTGKRSGPRIVAALR